ncbi:MAG: hypothetical protein FK734_10635 [Asgard group archaeon]|nr:hypothetical protein [Asgard group archaeon]
MGHELYNLVINNQNTEPYKSLINGKEYEVTYNGRTVKVKWNGLKNADKISLIAYYVYCYYLKQKATHISAVGAIKMKLENSDYANASNKIFSAWVKFSELYGDSNDSIIIPSAYNYLYENKDLFPEWEFTRKLVSMNGHGI